MLVHDLGFRRDIVQGVRELGIQLPNGKPATASLDVGGSTFGYSSLQSIFNFFERYPTKNFKKKISGLLIFKKVP